MTPKRLENSLPHAENPDAVYGIKNNIIINAAITVRIFLSSPNLLEKKSGIVTTSYACEYFLILLATISQLIYVPIASPNAVQNASAIPEIYATPGSPIRSQLLISDASALIAVTNGPSFLPPR